MISNKSKQRPDFTHKYNRSSGRHGWLRLTPAYSVKLVDQILNENNDKDSILDPFSGTATTPLCASYYGINATAIEINPDLAEAYINRSFAYSKKGQWAPCLADCDKAIELNPYIALAYVNRAYVYIEKGQYDLAIVDCSKAIEIDTNFVSAYLHRALAYYMQGKKTEAIADLEMVIALTDDPELLRAAQQMIYELSE